MARILIAGCGDVGGTLGLRLADAGHEVFGLRRSVGRLPPSLVPVAADLTRPASLGSLPARLDHVVYTAAASGRTDQAYRAAYVDGPRYLIAALERAGQRPARFVFTSSTAVYGQDDGTWVDEDAATEPRGFPGRRLLEGEAVVRGAPWTSIVVRLAGIYGPGRTRLLRRARDGEPVVRGTTAYGNRIHRDDCAGVLAHLLDIDQPAPVYLGVDHAPVPLAEVIDWICEHAGWPRPPDAEPDAAGDDRRGGNKRCANDRVLASGYRFRCPSYREGYAELLRDF